MSIGVRPESAESGRTQVGVDTTPGNALRAVPGQCPSEAREPGRCIHVCYRVPHRRMVAFTRLFRMMVRVTDATGVTVCKLVPSGRPVPVSVGDREASRRRQRDSMTGGAE